MYKLLIVDDEPFILDGLVDLFQENEDLDIYSAASGDKALELLSRTRMDIVLSDIRMPGTSGLELQKEIQKQWPYCKLVFLTAHSEFTYAYQAIQNNAVGYVLKSEGEEAIVEAVNRCIREIRRERQTQEFIKENEDYIASALPMLQSACLLKLLEGEPAEEYLRDFGKYRIRLNPDTPAVLVALRLDKKTLRGTSHNQLHLFLQIKAVFQKYLSDIFTGYEATFEGKNMIWVLQPNGERQGLLYLKETLEIVQAHCREALGASVSVIYDDYAEWRELPGRFSSVKLILNQMTVNEDELVLANSRFYLEQKGEDDERPEQDTERKKRLSLLRSCLEEEEDEQFFRTLGELLNEDAGPRDALLNNLELYHALTDMLLSYINARKLSKELFADQDHFELFYRFRDKSAMENGIVKLAGRIFELRQRKQATHGRNFAAKIKHYIAGHLSEDLSLAALAERFYINPVYMSRLYKQTTGSNLTDYITFKRIEHSERLLRETEIKIHQIAKESGYDSAAYFTRVFKKQNGITPNEYRARYAPSSPD
ncbi:response regulator transcription factor [Paenibacillus macerans]|uniref:response regulator transcription factor n=1 Tax=Paenibacillus macerans TaxID=44252 RepID=UPI003D323BB8